MAELQILIAHVEPQTFQSLEGILASCHCTFLAAHTVSETEQILSSKPVLLTFCERSLPIGGYGELLQWGEERGVSTPLVVLSHSIDEADYMEAMARGAFDYLAPPYRRADIELILRRRREPRIDLNLPVQVYGTNSDGFPFLQFAHTRNISLEGARLHGLSHKLEPGAVIGVRCYEREGHFRVVWVRGSAPESYEIGVYNLTPGNEIWGFWAPLPKPDTPRASG